MEQPLVITEVLPGDVYRVVELNNNKNSCFATTAHISHLKSWWLFAEKDKENPVEEGPGNPDGDD